MSRIPPGGPREIGVLTWLGSRIAGHITHTEPPAFITVLGRSRRQFWGWLTFAGSLMPGGSLPRRETEAIILRVAHLTDCAYERAHHRRLAARAGLSAQEIRDAAGLGGNAVWSERQRAMFDATEALVTTQDLDDETWTQLRRHLNERETLELIQLVGQYVQLGTTLRVLRIDPDPEI